MRKNHEDVLLALTRPCPACGSASGVPCYSRVTKVNGGMVGGRPIVVFKKNPGGKPCKPHSARLKGN